jgi:hypothetical protein
MAKADHKGQPSRIRRNVQQYDVTYRWSEDTKYAHVERVR